MRPALPWLWSLWSLACWTTLVPTASAQTWSLARQRPSLFEIVAVDPTAEQRWPFGHEDIAGDGLDTTSTEEAGVDLRTVYADARAGRLWLRAYVSATSTASTTALSFFFIDADERTTTGGPAQGAALWPALSDDPSPGGYELAIGVRADGSLIGAYSWDAVNKRWNKLSPPETSVVAERGVARDPIRLLGDEHAYAQVNIKLADIQLDDRCLANIFVRTWNDQAGKRAFGDVVDSWAVTCRPKLNGYGDPELLLSDHCTADDTCPGGGHCRGGICVFGYECNGDAACQSTQHCQSNICVSFVEQACNTNASCLGLVCEAGQCVACASSGARACAAGDVCAPDGRCLSPATGSYSGDPQANDSGAAASGERVQGGAFSCSVLRLKRGSPCLWLALLPLAWCRTRRRLRQLRAGRGGER